MRKKSIGTIQINWDPIIKVQCIPFVSVPHHGYINIAPYVVSMLLDPFHQTSPYQSLECGGS